MILLYLFFVVAIGVICWLIIYEDLFRDDPMTEIYDILSEEDVDLEKVKKYLKQLADKWDSLYGPEPAIKPWTDQLDEQFKLWEMNGK